MSAPSDRRDGRELVRLQVEEVWGRGRIELIPAIYAPDVVDHMPVPGQAPGLEPMAAVVRAFRTALPDLAMTLDSVVAEGDRVVDLWTLTGTHLGPLLGHPPSGRRVSIRGMDMVRVEGGLIREIWHVEEMLQLLLQVGAIGPLPETV